MQQTSVDTRETTWQIMVQRRYGGWCQWPSCNSRAASADRIHDAPDLRFELGNGIPFCPRHLKHPARIQVALGELPHYEGG
jgi:hypothetical protein